MKNILKEIYIVIVFSLCILVLASWFMYAPTLIKNNCIKHGGEYIKYSGCKSYETKKLYSVEPVVEEMSRS